MNKTKQRKNIEHQKKNFEKRFSTEPELDRNIEETVNYRPKPNISLKTDLSKNHLSIIYHRPLSICRQNSKYFNVKQSEQQNENYQLSSIRGIDQTNQIEIQQDSNKNEIKRKISKSTQRFLFIFEPIINGFILFPLIVLNWQSGWNLLNICFDSIQINYFHLLFNQTNLQNNEHHLEEEEEEQIFYSYQFLFIFFILTQCLLIHFYLLGNHFFKFLNRCHWLIVKILLEIHIFFLTILYIIQWDVIWILWDQYGPKNILFKLTISFASLFCLISLTGHLADLIYSPFLMCYNSIDWCIDIQTPFQIHQMKYWQSQLINYIFYEYVISNLSIMSWKGIYDFIDEYFYSENILYSSLISLSIGYFIYFPSMYFQKYFEKDSHPTKSLMKFFSINFPEFNRNLRHSFSCFSCILLWRGYWVFYDEYLDIFSKLYQTYFFSFVVSFIILSFLQVSSSINGPLNHVDDPFQYFPLYPHCYLTMIYMKLSKQLFHSSSKQNEQQINSIQETQF